MGSAVGPGPRHSAECGARLMFFPEGRIRVHLYGQPCDMRKSFDGLSALVRNALGREPMDGSLYVYVNRKTTQMRVLYFDRSGYCVCPVCQCDLEQLPSAI